MRFVTLVVAATFVSAAASRAQEPVAPKIQDRVDSVIAPTVPSRFNFIRVDDAFLRLDNQTGQVAYCAPNGAGWTCQAVPEHSASLEKQVTRLQAEVGALKEEIAAQKKEIADLREPPPPLPPLPVPPPDDRRFTLAPSHEQVMRVRAYLAQTWARVMEMMASWQNQMMRAN